MNHLKDAIGKIARPLPRLGLGATPLVEESAGRISPRDGVDQKRAHKDYDALAHDFRDRLWAASPLSGRELRDAAWCLWATTPALADQAAVLRILLKGIERHERRGPGRVLASSYMVSFDRDRPGIEDVSASLRRIADRLGRPWTGLQRDMNLFHWRDGPQAVARRALDRRTSPTAILRDGGLGTLIARSGFAKTCTAAALDQLAGKAHIDADDRLTLVRDLALDDDGRLLFDEHAPLLANALTSPFGDTLPDKKVRDRYLDVLLNLFKDPRLPQHGWTRMPGAAERVRRWLTEQTLRQFLDVVDQVAKERMWKYRRAFWEAVYDQDLISEAWVVFERRGASTARRSFGEKICFAGFDGTVQAGHAVLLLRIGRAVVAEWSHDGRCIIWDDAERAAAPKLYQGRYSPNGLRVPAGPAGNSVFSCVHHGADLYRWQGKVAKKIKEITNTRIPQSAYEVH